MKGLGQAVGSEQTWEWLDSKEVEAWIDCLVWPWVDSELPYWMGGTRKQIF